MFHNIPHPEQKFKIKKSLFHFHRPRGIGKNQPGSIETAQYSIIQLIDQNFSLRKSPALQPDYNVDIQRILPE